MYWGRAGASRLDRGGNVCQGRKEGSPQTLSGGKGMSTRTSRVVGCTGAAAHKRWALRHARLPGAIWKGLVGQEERGEARKA